MAPKASAGKIVLLGLVLGYVRLLFSGALKLDWKKTTSREICYDRKIEESLFIHLNERETRIVVR
ncbi:hypothetical protein HanIR_Chr03g0131891 [Helianthus annuus]|nr:hypothetical protein HanIR_Chr03g0131891 [Helianthus annuus]